MNKLRVSVALLFCSFELVFATNILIHDSQPGPFVNTSYDALTTFVLKTDHIAPYIRSYIGNGNFSLASSPLGIESSESFMAGVYDHADDDIPRIAALPVWNEIRFYNGIHWLNDTEPSEMSIKLYEQKLNMYDGLLKTNYDWVDSEKTTSIEVTQFISRANQNVAVISFTIKPHYSNRVKIVFSLYGRKEPSRMSLAKLEKVESGTVNGWPSVWYPGFMAVKGVHAVVNRGSGELSLVSISRGRGTVVAEAAVIRYPVTLQNASVKREKRKDYVAIEISFSCSADSIYTFYKYVGISSSSESNKPLETAKQAAANCSKEGFKLSFNNHKEAWHKLWQTDILVQGNQHFQTLIHSMIFYLLCSVRENTQFSIPPMGLSSSGYYGHIFWDADTWMLPPLLLMHPDIAKSVVMFRHRTLKVAMRNAKQNGYRGAMYPWESDELGEETTPRFAYQNALYENHVTADVAIGQWQYYLATGDTQWLREYGYKVIREGANFWVSRAIYNGDKDRFEIKNVVSVDEGLIGIDNDAYTNAAAMKTLEIAVEASDILHLKPNPKWAEVCQKLLIPFDATGNYHPTYENAPPSTRGSVVPLLSYPLELPMKSSTKRNDLQNAYELLRRSGLGVMMSVTLYPIVAAEIEDTILFNRLFEGSYKDFLRGPFNVLAETPQSNSVNFLTGAGGFLQQVIFGYTGLRIGRNGLEKKYKPTLPAGIDKIILKNFSIRGKRVDVIVHNGEVEIIMKDRLPYR